MSSLKTGSYFIEAEKEEHSPRLLYSPPYPAVGNYRREEAIMLLRRFYITENTSGPSSPPLPLSTDL